MVATIPESLRRSIRDYAIGVGTRNPRMVLQAYRSAGVLLPGSDDARLEQLTADMMNRFSDLRLGDIRGMAVDEARYFMTEYRDLIFDAPLQFPIDLLFVLRAVSMLAGLTTTLDPDFSPFDQAVPFATRLALGSDVDDPTELGDRLFDGAAQLLGLPFRLEQLLSRAEEGSLVVTTQLSSDTMRGLGRVERANKRMAGAISAAGLLIGGSLLVSVGQTAIVGWCLIVTASFPLLRVLKS